MTVKTGWNSACSIRFRCRRGCAGRSATFSDEEGILQVLITGGVHDMTDIDFPEAIADKLSSFGDGVLQQFEERGLTFTAGQE